MGKTAEERIGVNEEAIGTLKKSDIEQWEAINALRKRLPNWATILISVLTFFLGSVSGALLYAIKNGG